jgi:hypothetical protein
VAKGSARLRITVTAAHGEPQVHGLCAALLRHAEGLREGASAYRPPIALVRSKGEGTRAGF